MSESMGLRLGEGLASWPSRDTTCGRGKAAVAARILLPFALGIVVFTVLVCDSRRYHGVARDHQVGAIGVHWAGRRRRCLQRAPSIPVGDLTGQLANKRAQSVGMPGKAIWG